MEDPGNSVRAFTKRCHHWFPYVVCGERVVMGYKWDVRWRLMGWYGDPLVVMVQISLGCPNKNKCHHVLGGLAAGVPPTEGPWPGPRARAQPFRKGCGAASEEMKS